MSLGKLWEMVRDREAWALQFMGSQRVRHDWVIEQQRCTRIDVHEIEKNKYDSYWIFYFYFKLCILYYFWYELLTKGMMPIA